MTVLAMQENYLLHGPEPLVPISMDSLGQQLYHCLLQYKHLPSALVDAVTSKSRSYSEIFESTCRLAVSLKKYGIKSNSVIAVCSENNLNYVDPVIAALYLGMTVTAFNPYFTTREMLHAANIAKPVIIFCSEAALDVILEVKEKLRFIQKVMVIDTENEHAGCDCLKEFISKHYDERSDATNFKPVNVDTLTQIAFILFSSGTTGLPKGVMLTHDNMNTPIANARDTRYAECFKPGTKTIFGLLPFYHAYGFYVVLLSVLLGRRIVILKAFAPDLYLKTIQNYKIDILYVVPSLANFLAKSPLIDNYDLSSVHTVRCGAAPLSRNTMEILMRRLKLKQFREGYGMTESTIGVLGFQLGDSRAGSCGKVLPYLSGKVIDPDTGRILSPLEKGELCFKGRSIMKGYAGDPKATEKAIDKDGWLRTGDVGYHDEDGYIYIVDRLKEIIKYKGFQVPPAELEAILLTHPKIIDAGVTGLPDENAGELPLAFVVKDPEQDLTEQEVKDFVAKQVAPQKRLHGGVRFVSEIPKNRSGKILRKVLQNLLHSPKSKL